MNRQQIIILYYMDQFTNPMMLSSLSDFIFWYFTQNPWIDQQWRRTSQNKHHEKHHGGALQFCSYECTTIL